MPVPILLEDAVEEILDAMVSVLEAATESESSPPAVDLSEVATVVRGDRARPQPRNPSLWVFPGLAVADHTTHGLAEAWTMPVTLAALVSSDDPEQGARDCVRLAARARRCVLRDRDLALAYVQDVVSTRLDPGARTSERNRNLHWADAIVTVRFKIWEASA